MKNKPALSDFVNELSQIGFDKKKVQGLVKRANTAGYNIYYAYHEDNADTWRNKWSEGDYMNNSNDVKIFEATTLIGKSKGGGNFRRGQSYTAECAIFVFCPLSTILEDAILRELQINAVEKMAEKHAAADYERSMKAKEKFDIWNNLPESNKIEINNLTAERDALLGIAGSRLRRIELMQQINELGGNCYPLSEWQIVCTSFNSLEEYAHFKKTESVKNMIESAKKEFEFEY